MAQALVARKQFARGIGLSAQFGAAAASTAAQDHAAHKGRGWGVWNQGT